MRGSKSPWPALLGVLAAGCVPESHVPTDPVALERFCRSFFDAVCSPLEGCECGAATVSDCRAEERRLCADFPSAALVRAVDEGRVRYDAERAAALLRRLRGRGCAGFVATLDWRAADLFDLGGTFVGTGTAGEACTPLGFELVSECAGGSCVPADGAHACRATADEGERCGPLAQCVDLDAALRTGGAIDRLVLRCEPAGDDEGVCRAWRAEGEACASGAECWTGRCEAERCVAIALGGECLSSRECAAGHYCASLRCAAGGAPDGAECDDAGACASQVCVAGRCRPAGCDVF